MSSFLNNILQLSSMTVLMVFAACSGGEDRTGSIHVRDLARLGGDATVFDASVNAYSLPPQGIAVEESREFFKGRALFRDPWVIAPSSTLTRDGLGPNFNARSCEGCHVRDGRGRPPEEGRPFTSMLVRISLPGQGVDGGPVPVPFYGDQIQNFSIPNVPPEAQPRVDYEEVTGTYADGAPYTLMRPIYRLESPAFGPLPSDLLISPRVAPGMVGLGLLAAIPESEIRAGADPDDADGDGVSGRVNEVFDHVSGGPALGRFGWKANQPNLKQQTAGAFLGDIGITSTLFPGSACVEGQDSCFAAEAGDSPELLDAILTSVTTYSALLAVPAARPLDEGLFTEGFKRFTEARCDACHRSEWRTGASDFSAVYNNQRIFPFTDLLLHDMGEGLADGRSDYAAGGHEWRTPPLWGLGLQSVVNGHQRLLHDGRARSFAEAVLWHGGEAEAAKERFRRMPAADRRALIYFLESL